jgi:hypothetical protein
MLAKLYIDSSLIILAKASLLDGEICLESLNSDIGFFKITAAAVTGPARHPLPTSSTPAIITIDY